MKDTFLSVALFAIFYNVHAQREIISNINATILRTEAEAHLSFLASDEMRGRDAGSNELEIAANYIRTQFRLLGLGPAPNTEDYYQKVDLVKYPTPSRADVTIAKEEFKLKDNLLVLNGGTVNWNGGFVYVGYGASEDLAKHDVKGKMVLALAGSRESDNINKAYGASREKFQRVKKLGAAGLVEVLPFPQVPWPALINFFHKEKWSLKEGEDIPFVWLKPRDFKALGLKENEPIKGRISITAPPPQYYAGKNVAALVEGTDPVLKNEYVILTAHYDHIGVTREEGAVDSIFNGARDNATGTVALLQTAKFLSAYKPKRSVIVMAVTCEEKGLLGSSWYIHHPLVPLNKTVLNLNSDGVGYNDKTRVTSISLGRTNMDPLLEQAAKAYDFSLGGDPDPTEGFYERSDQVSFAREGIPAIKLQPGLVRMDEEILKYYHRTADEFSSLDMDYITRFYRTFIYAVHLIANDNNKPKWKEGDKFEEASKKLYGD